MAAPAGMKRATQLRTRLEQAEAELKQFSDSAALTERAATLLARARGELATGHLVEAHDLVVRLECLLARAAQSRETLRHWGPYVGVYEVLLLGGLLALVLVGPGELGLRSASAPPWEMVLLPYCVWGALGGVVSALFGMYLHASRRDFDRGYLAFYFLKPLLGLALGPLVYLFAKAGLMATQPGAAEIARHELLYLGAFVVGFGERFSLRLIDRVAAAIFGTTENSGSSTSYLRTSLPVGNSPGAPDQPPCLLRVKIAGPEAEARGDVWVKLLREGEEIQSVGPGPNAEGGFCFVGLAPGGYEVQVSKPGWRQASPAGVELGMEPEEQEVEVVLAPGE